jgi:hypothetical protein
MAPNDCPITSITSNSAKHNHHDAEQLTFYPAFCFKASPTHFAWVKLTASDVHRLRKRVEFAGPFVFFFVHFFFFSSMSGFFISMD